MSLLLGWGAYARDKNTSTRLCAKRQGGLMCEAVGRICGTLRYLHAKIASLANVKSCVIVGPISLMANFWPCIVPVNYLSGLAL